jgi:signal transduction histidine kinase
MATVMVPAAGRVGAADDRGFYVAMAAGAVAVAFTGFAWRYFLPLRAGTLHATSLVHVHGLLMWSWTLLYFAQAWLASRGRLRQHRLFGMAGIALMTLCVWTGASVAILQLDRQLAAGAGDAARAFVIQPLGLVLVMPLLFGAAIVHARRPDAHARLMLLVTLVALQPALARLAQAMLGAGQPLNAMLAGGVILLTIGACMVRDLRSRGRVHPAYVYGGALVLVVQLARIALAGTPAWYSAADALRTLAR